MARDSDDRRPLRLDEGVRLAAVVSTYHHELTGTMAASARATLLAAGLAETNWLEVLVPGAFELPLVAQTLLDRRDLDAVLCFGLVLKGETEHDRYISQAVAQALMQLGLASQKPCLFGLLTCPTLAHAEARARVEAEGGLDKGAEVARAAIGTLTALRNARRELGTAEISS